jgi:hypothetical protein
VPALTSVSACIVLAASLARRPVYRIEGKTDAFDVLYPSAMSPAWSIATLPIQR